MNFTYLGSPYTPRNITNPLMGATLREKRFQAACKAAAYLMRRGEVVFCPIAHSHPIDLFFPQAQSGEFWRIQDRPFLLMCAKLVVLELPGWEQSVGLAHEIEVAEGRGIPISYLSPL